MDWVPKPIASVCWPQLWVEYPLVLVAGPDLAAAPTWDHSVQ